MFLASNRETEHDQFSIGIAGEGSSFICLCVCWPRSTQDIQGQNMFAASIQCERCTFSDWMARKIAGLFRIFLYFFPEEDESRVWSDMRRWTSFPHRRLSSSISPPPPLSWSFNSGCVSRLSGMNIVSVPQNQPYWIMSRALCEMPSG